MTFTAPRSAACLPDPSTFYAVYVLTLRMASQACFMYFVHEQTRRLLRKLILYNTATAGW